MTSSLTTKGRITIPKQIRDLLHLRAGSRVDFQIDPAGRVILKPCDKDIRSLKGIVRSFRKTPVSLEEMDEAIAQGFAGKN